jgi:hypothetical protein
MTRHLLFVLVLTAACAAPATELVECPPKGCAALDPPTPSRQALLAHAERDLVCPQAQLDVTELGRYDAIVSGCGRQARYAHLGYAPYHWRWLLDSPVTAAR